MMYVFDPMTPTGYVARVPFLVAWIWVRFNRKLDYWHTPEGDTL